MKGLFFFLCAGMLHAQGTSAEDVAAGGRIFRSHCAECHGLKGEGGRGPALSTGEYRHGSSDEALFRTISNGIPGTQMPGVFFSERQVWQIVRFVRSLAATGSRILVPGDPTAGERLFRGKGTCGQCHRVRGEGGSLGPDLSQIGSIRTPSHLRASILRPDEDILFNYWSVEATGKDGTTYSGIRLNEDSYSLQVMDLRENLHSLAKKDLQALKVEKKSRMPAYEGTFTAAELDDLVAYLYSLQRKEQPE